MLVISDLTQFFSFWSQDKIACIWLALLMENVSRSKVCYFLLKIFASPLATCLIPHLSPWKPVWRGWFCQVSGWLWANPLGWLAGWANPPVWLVDQSHQWACPEGKRHQEISVWDFNALQGLENFRRVIGDAHWFQAGTETTEEFFSL